MTNIIELTDNVIGVVVPEDTYGHSYSSYHNDISAHQTDEPFGDIDWFSGKLPNGKWQIIALSTNITEEQASSIVRKIDFGRTDLFNNYTAKNCMDFRDIVDASFDTAIGSFHSLLKSKGIQEPILILKREI